MPWHQSYQMHQGCPWVARRGERKGRSPQGIAHTDTGVSQRAASEAPVFMGASQVLLSVAMSEKPQAPTCPSPFLPQTYPSVQERKTAHRAPQGMCGWLEPWCGASPSSLLPPRPLCRQSPLLAPMTSWTRLCHGSPAPSWWISHLALLGDSGLPKSRTNTYYQRWWLRQ